MLGAESPLRDGSRSTELHEGGTFNLRLVDKFKPGVVLINCRAQSAARPPTPLGFGEAPSGNWRMILEKCGRFSDMIRI
jgi:hypothetical protein